MVYGFRFPEPAPKRVFLASFPRSGNTFLRTLLNACFGLRSTSVYTNDLGGNSELERVVGHVEHSRGERLPASQGLHLVKTHEIAKSADLRAIYVVRNPVFAYHSLFDFYRGRAPLEAIIQGKSRFGRWSDHVGSWSQLGDGRRLLLTFEALSKSPEALFDEIGGFLDQPVLSRMIPNRREIAAVDGKWVRPAAERAFDAETVRAIVENERATMERFGYPTSLEAYPIRNGVRRSVAPSAAARPVAAREPDDLPNADLRDLDDRE